MLRARVGSLGGLTGGVFAACVSVVCLVLGPDGGLELEVGFLAFADAPEVGFLVGGDAVVADVEGRQCPDGGMDGAGVSEMYIRMAWRLTGTWAVRRPQQSHQKHPAVCC